MMARTQPFATGRGPTPEIKGPEALLSSTQQVVTLRLGYRM